MTSLISEIQRDALDSSIPIESLLRQVKLAAAKLQLETLEVWVEQELSGYRGEIPDYRKAYGQPAAWNPYNGWIPVQTQDERIADLISTARIAESISSLRDLVKTEDRNNPLHFPVPSGLVSELNKMMNFQTARMVIQISRGHVINILDQVRNMVLDWAIKMEKQGIVGEGMSFNTREREEAKQVMANFSVGNIGTFTGNLGTGNSSGDISFSKQEVVDLTQKIQSSFNELEQAGVDIEKLTKTVDAINSEMETGNVNSGRLSNLLSDARSILIGASGNLTAEGAIAGISGLLKLLGNN